MISKRALLGTALGALAALALLAAWPVLRRSRDAGNAADARAVATKAGRASETPLANRRAVGAAAEPTAVALDCASAQGLAATVDARPIPVTRLCDRLRLLTGASSPAAGRQVLEQLIEAELVAGALAARGARITEAEVDAELRALERDQSARSASPAALVELRVAARERVARQKLVDALGLLEPSAAELRAPAGTRDQLSAAVEGWIARVPGNAPADAIARAQAAASAGLERLRRGADPSSTGLRRLPAFELSQGAGEPALEAALLRAGGPDWQGPVRTRAGFVVARTTHLQRAPPPADPEDARRAAMARIRQREERRILSDLRAAAVIVRYIE